MSDRQTYPKFFLIPYVGIAFGGSLYRFAVFRMSLSHFLRISLENRKERRKERKEGKKNTQREREGERAREFSIDNIIALPSPFIAVLVLELFICVRLHRQCENDTKGDPLI